MSRPVKKINWKVVDEMLIAGCPGTEIAAIFGMHPETFYDKVKSTFNIGFSDYLQIKASEGKSNIRVHQYKKALGLSKKGDNTMLIWVGKQLCDQRENHEVSIQPETMTQFKQLMDQISKNQEESSHDD